MLAEYINRKKEKHYLKAVTTKNGKNRYYIVKNISTLNTSELLSKVPEGFEFYEFPSDAQVSIRKKLITNITNDDIKVINTVMQKHATIKDYIIDKDKNGIVIYIAHLDIKDFPTLKNQFHLLQSYNAKLRFEKEAHETYKAQRFCYLSKYDDWITMETNVDLAYLAQKYCYHIDKESLLRFWIEGEEDW